MAITKMREEAIGPVVVLTQDQIAQLYNLLSDFTSTGADASGSEVSPPDLYVKLTNTDELKLGEINDIHTVANRRNNLIRGVRMIGIGLEGRLVQLSFENRQSRSAGFLMLNGPPDEVDNFLSGVRAIVGEEKPLKYFLASIHPVFVALLATLIFNFLSGLGAAYFTHVVALDFASGLNMTLGYLTIFVAIPFLVFLLVFERVQQKFIGRFVAGWGDGAIRFERAITITNWILFSVPLAVALKIGVDLIA